MPEERATLEREGVLYVPSQYGDPTPITRGLIEDGGKASGPERTFADPLPGAAVARTGATPTCPGELALRIAEQVETDDVRVVLVKDGDHRLSRPSDLALLRQTLGALLSEDGT